MIKNVIIQKPQQRFKYDTHNLSIIKINKTTLGSGDDKRKVCKWNIKKTFKRKKMMLIEC